MKYVLLVLSLVAVGVANHLLGATVAEQVWATLWLGLPGAGVLLLAGWRRRCHCRRALARIWPITRAQLQLRRAVTGRLSF